MKSVMSLMVTLVVLLASPAAFAEGFWHNPVIQGAGQVHALPDAAYQPDPDATYKIVFGMTVGSKDPAKVNPAVEHVARLVNLYADAGVPMDHLKIVAVAGGPATIIALDNEHYKDRFGTDNPNLPIISELEKQGVEIAVCGQSAAAMGIKYDWISPDITLTLSAMTTLIELQKQGYALIAL